MAEHNKAAAGPPLDETWWSQPIAPADLHNNSILFYFADSPFFDKTSNNWIIFQQSLANLSMRHLISTREAFEGRLKTMSGLEFIVAQEPAETGPGMGTGVWVINKQTRRKRQNEEDEIIVHATYFMIGDKVFQAPSLADVMSARMVGKIPSRLERLKANSLYLGHHIIFNCQDISYTRLCTKMVPRVRASLPEPEASRHSCQTSRARVEGSYANAGRCGKARFIYEAKRQ